MKNILTDIFIMLLLIAGGLTGGYFIGKRNVQFTTKKIVEYKTLPAIHADIEPVLVNVSIPDAPQFLFFTDTLTGKMIIDTIAILDDWVKRREYGGRVIDDSSGTIDYSATIQYNQLQQLTIDYQPLQRNTTIIKTITPRFIPFVFAGGNSAGFTQVEAGAFLGRWGFAAECGTNFRNTNYIGGKIGITF